MCDDKCISMHMKESLIKFISSNETTTHTYVFYHMISMESTTNEQPHIHEMMEFSRSFFFSLNAYVSLGLGLCQLCIWILSVNLFHVLRCIHANVLNVIQTVYVRKMCSHTFECLIAPHQIMSFSGASLIHTHKHVRDDSFNGTTKRIDISQQWTKLKSSLCICLYLCLFSTSCLPVKWKS